MSLNGDNGTGTIGVALTANNTITIDENMSLYNGFSTGNWVFTAPTVSLNDGAHINQLTAPTSITIHTNNLNFGNGSNGNPTYIIGNGVTIDDNGGMVFTTTGLTITTNAINQYEYIQSLGSALVINATSSPTSSLLMQAVATNSVLVLDGDNGTGTSGVALTANNSITVGHNTVVENSYSSGNWF